MHGCRWIKTIPPGPVDTSFYPGQQTAESAANAARRVPAQRLGECRLLRFSPQSGDFVAARSRRRLGDRGVTRRHAQFRRGFEEGNTRPRRRPIHAPALKGNRYQCLNRCASVRP